MGKIFFDKTAGGLPVGTKIDRDKASRYRGHRTNQGIGMDITAEISLNQVTKIGLHHNAGRAEGHELFKFPVEALPLSDNGMDKVRQRFTLHRHLTLKANNRVIPCIQFLSKRRSRK